jgi:Protein of unknown function (DUF3040)
MSLSAWEQQALDSIEEGLVRSDPQLTSLLTWFTRLASGEEMPVRENIPASSWRAIRDLWRGRRRGTRTKSSAHARLMRQRAGFRRAALLVYLLLGVASIAVAVAVGLGSSNRGCPSAFGVPCVSPARAHSPRPGEHDRAADQTPGLDGPHPAPG